MNPKLILLNGNPGMGKSTLAQRYVDEHPMTLNLDLDRIWHMMGQWQESMPLSGDLQFEYGDLLARAHLARGFDVIVAQLIERKSISEMFERAAKASGAILKEFVLMSDADDAINRCIVRGKALGYSDGYRPGGLLDSNGREHRLNEMFTNVQTVISERPDIVVINSVYGHPDETYKALLKSLI
jgi:predicted kinase